MEDWILGRQKATVQGQWLIQGQAAGHGVLGLEPSSLHSAPAYGWLYNSTSIRTCFVTEIQMNLWVFLLHSVYSSAMINSMYNRHFAI